MQTYIILLRAVNVGGNNLLPMKELKSALQTAGFGGVKTYIQSGNILLQSKQNPEQEVRDLILRKFGFSPQVWVFSQPEFELAISNNPYSEFEGKQVHFYFCKSQPALDTEKLESLVAGGERYQLVDNVFYLHAQNGIGRSKLVANIDACLGVTSTGRNLNTIHKLAAMLAS